jgi:glucose-1-phosphate thymidylyltransferase
MKIVIPTAGYGTRLRPHTWSKPKPLISVAGKPVLGHVLDMFNQMPSIDEVIIIVGYLGEQIEDYVEQAYPHLKTRYIEQRELIGQSHAIWLARESVHGPTMIAFVDTLVETDLITGEMEDTRAIGWVKEVDDPRRFGVAEVGPDGWVRRLIEKPQDMNNNLAVVGLYYFQDGEALVAAIEEQMRAGQQLKGEYYLADAINIMLEKGLKMRVQPVEVWNDCGKPEALLRTNRYLLEHSRDNSPESSKRKGVVIVPPVFIDPSANIDQSVIGPHASIGPGCEIHRSIVQDSIIDQDSEIIDTTLSQSLIGRQVRVVGRHRSLNIGDSSEVVYT